MEVNMKENTIGQGQREIKFRAWVPKVKRICIVSEIYSDGTFNAEDYYKKGEQKGCAMAKGILMQYTGLKDKNGVEIYEYDILEREDTENETKEYLAGKGFVKYNKKRTRFDIGFLHEYNSTNQGTIVGNVNIDCNIIGNIYENPELLSEK